VAAAVAAVWLTLEADFLAYPGWLAAQKADFILGRVLIGMYWLRRRPQSRFGPMIRMPPSDSDEELRVAATLRETHPQIGVVALSQLAEPRYGLALLDSGPDRRAYLLKERVQHGGQLVSAIEAVAEGGSVIDGRLVEDLVMRCVDGWHGSANRCWSRS
jgi:DNA-binding NarL/FixJ family response regulator